MQLLNMPPGGVYFISQALHMHIKEIYLVSVVFCFHASCREVWVCVDLGQFRLTTWMFMVGSGQVWYLKVIHGWRQTLSGASPVPLVQSVPRLRAQHPGRLFLLKVLDESHSSVRAGQIVATCTSTETELVTTMGGVLYSQSHSGQIDARLQGSPLKLLRAIETHTLEFPQCH